MFIVNAYVNQNDVDDAIAFLSENTQDDIEYFCIPHTRALQTAENEGVSIIEFANSSGLKKHTYKKISTIINNLMSKIKEYV